MKRVFYIASFGLLGLIVSTLAHAVVEMVALQLIFGDPNNVTSVWWREWELIHAVYSAALWTAGLFLGLFAGVTWWGEYGSKPGAFGWGGR